MTPGQETAWSAPARYELTVAGRIGPVLRCALQPPGGDAAQVCVVVRASGPDGMVGLLQVLAAHGLEVRHVACVPDQG
jgi:hypothetical protein